MKRYGSDSFLIRYAVVTRAVSLHLKFLRYERDIKKLIPPLARLLEHKRMQCLKSPLNEFLGDVHLPHQEAGITHESLNCIG